MGVGDGGMDLGRIASLADHFGGRRVSINAHGFTATALYFTATAYATALCSTLHYSLESTYGATVS